MTFGRQNCAVGLPKVRVGNGLERLDDYWEGVGPVQFYRRPLTAISASLAEVGFVMTLRVGAKHHRAPAGAPADRGIPGGVAEELTVALGHQEIGGETFQNGEQPGLPEGAEVAAFSGAPDPCTYEQHA